MLVYDWLQPALLAGQLLFAFVAIRLLLKAVPQKKLPWKHLSYWQWRERQIADSWLALLRLHRQQPAFRERSLLLSGCGFTFDPGWYIALRRLLLITGGIGFMTGSLIWIPAGRGMLPLCLLLGALSGVYFDLPWLRSWRKMRAMQLTREIYAVSNQLLYLAESSLHLHAKLTRCIPFTRLLSVELERLLAEWYYDAGSALQRFKQTLGTEEAASFVETLDALRMHESQNYYELLRLRIADYKEKLELDKASRKETTSYALFVMAGIPIMYTFQIFIYPWVREGQLLLGAMQ